MMLSSGRPVRIDLMHTAREVALSTAIDPALALMLLLFSGSCGHDRAVTRYSADQAKRFWLAEKLSCCGVRTPSRAHPFSQLSHGRTIVHVANLEGADLKAVRRLVRLIEAAKDVDCPHELQTLLSKHKPRKRSSGAITPLETPDAP